MTSIYVKLIVMALIILLGALEYYTTILIPMWLYIGLFGFLVVDTLIGFIVGLINLKR